MTMFAATLLALTTISSGATDQSATPAASQDARPIERPAAQPTDADRIRQRVKEGQQVRVTDDQGNEWRGRIAALAADRLTVVRRGRAPADVAYANIVRIDRPHDGLTNGAAIGFAAGAAFGLASVIAEANRDCVPEAFFSCFDPTPAPYVLVPAVVGGLGAAIGVGVDALIRRDPNLYRRAGAVRLTVVPTVAPGARGVAVALRW